MTSQDLRQDRKWNYHELQARHHPRRSPRKLSPATHQGQVTKAGALKTMASDEETKAADRYHTLQYQGVHQGQATKEGDLKTTASDEETKAADRRTLQDRHETQHR